MPAKRTAPILAALPDLISAAVFLFVWIQASWFGVDVFIGIAQSMLIELLVVFTVFMFWGVAFQDEGPNTPARRTAFALFLTALFALFIWRFPVAPLVSATAFAWLAFSRLLGVWLTAGRGTEPGRSQYTQLGIALIAYIPLLLLTVTMINLPNMGITTQIVSDLHARLGYGAWTDRPQSLLAFGMSYFVVQAVVKFWQTYLAMHPESSWMAPVPEEINFEHLAQDVDGSRNAAQRLAQSGYSRAQISHELQQWRGLGAADADALAAGVTSKNS